MSVGDAAKPLMNDDIKTFSIGIGTAVDKDELRAMVEYDEDVITAANFDALIKKSKNITELTCDEIGKRWIFPGNLINLKCPPNVCGNFTYL